jgi:hypothetical protein
MDVNLARHQGEAAAVPGDAHWPDGKLCYLAVHFTNQSSSAYLKEQSVGAGTSELGEQEVCRGHGEHGRF